MPAVLPGKPQAKLQAISVGRWQGQRIVVSSYSCTWSRKALTFRVIRACRHTYPATPSSS